MSQELFESVKRTIFPRWDRSKGWRFQEIDGLLHTGHCNSELKTIEMQKGQTLLEVRVLIVHEICHAVTNGSHGRPWSRRMEKAASRAEQIGDTDFATAIRNHLEWVNGGHDITASMFYNRITEMVMDTPDSTEEQILTSAGRNEVNLNYEEVVRHYPRARKVFRSAKKMAQAARPMPKG